MRSNIPSPVRDQRKLRILCVDDDSMLSDVLVRLFSTAGHEVHHAANGLEAWDMVSMDIAYFDVLITDHQMPGLGGLELVELLHEADYSGRIVVHSSAISDLEHQRYRALGVSRVVRKPARAEELLAVVETVHTS